MEKQGREGRNEGQQRDTCMQFSREHLLDNTCGNFCSGEMGFPPLPVALSLTSTFLLLSSKPLLWVPSPRSFLHVSISMSSEEGERGKIQLYNTGGTNTVYYL